MNINNVDDDDLVPPYDRYYATARTQQQQQPQSPPPQQPHPHPQQQGGYRQQQLPLKWTNRDSYGRDDYHSSHDWTLSAYFNGSNCGILIAIFVIYILHKGTWSTPCHPLLHTHTKILAVFNSVCLFNPFCSLWWMESLPSRRVTWKQSLL